MFEFIRIHQLDIMMAMCATSATMVVLLYLTRFLPRRRKWILILLETMSTLLLAFDRAAYLYSGDVSRKGYIMVRISNFALFFLTISIVFGFNLYLIDWLSSEGMMRVIPLRLKVVGVCTALDMLLVIIAHFTGWFYYFDEFNRYHRGGLFLISYIVPIFGPILQFTVIWQYRKTFGRIIYTALVLYIFVPMAMGIIQIMTYGISIINMSMVAVSICLYIFTYFDINNVVERAHRIEVDNLREERGSMKRLFDQTATSFMAAVEKKDPYIMGHSARTAEIAGMIAKECGKDEEECDMAYYTALLHDIGIVDLPDSLLEKDDILSEEEEEIMKDKPLISSEILSAITEIPDLWQNAKYTCERYDGSGYPDGLSGEDIPEISRIVAVADAYVTMASGRRSRNRLPKPMVRDELMRGSGTLYDPYFTQVMVRIMDSDDKLADEEDIGAMEKELLCGEYRSSISTGIELSEKVKKITFLCSAAGGTENGFSAPSIVLFDSYDRRVHNNERTIGYFKYVEYGEIWFDGHSISTDTRNILIDTRGNLHESISGLAGGEEDRYEITATRFEDHLKLILKSFFHTVECVIALPDMSKAAYIGITGEHCHITDINIEQTGVETTEGDIKRIADEISFIDRLESDIPNIQVDRQRSATTEGVLIKDDMRITFHAMSLPSATLVWHCPYLVLYHSGDGRVYGEGYREFTLIKLNGEKETSDEHADNRFSMKKTDSFPGWDKWREAFRRGIECRISFGRKGNRVMVTTDNLGISIENVLTVDDWTENIYAAITGDLVALTDIRISY